MSMAEDIALLKLEAKTKEGLLIHAMKSIEAYFSNPCPTLRKQLLECYADIREHLNLGGRWGDEG